MSTNKHPQPADYVVGYRRPPIATRFQPGTSGNPKGRPKETRTVGAILQDVIQQKIEITEDGKTRLIAPIEGMLRRLVKDAVSGGKGDGPLKLFLSVLDRYGLSSETAIKLGDLLAEDQAILARYLPPEQPTSPDTSVSPAPEPKSDEGGDDYGV
jgi:hypothetical protein